MHVLPDRFQFTAVLGAALIFLVQPLVGKTVLPCFGGTYSVWATILLFFQTVLLLGYGLVHLLLGNTLTGLRKSVVGGLLVVGACGALAVAPQALLIDELTAPVFRLLYRLALGLGVPAIVLCMNGVLLIRLRSEYFDRLDSYGHGAKRDGAHALFGWSNAGSIIGLLAFPFVVEPWLSVAATWSFWRGCYLLWVASALFCLVSHRQNQTPQTASQLDYQPDSQPDPQLDARLDFPPDSQPDAQLDETLDTAAIPRGGWLLPATAGTCLLTATTTVITQDVTAMPILWVIPLFVYLLTFIQAFRGPFPAPPMVFLAIPLFFCSGLFGYLLLVLGIKFDPILTIAALLFFLYHGCRLLHVLLAWRRPTKPQELTGFYLTVSFGGILGTFLATIVPPLFATGLMEYPLSWFVLAVALWPDRWRSGWHGDPYLLLRLAGIALIVFVLPYIGLSGLPALAPLLVSALIGAMVYIYIVIGAAHQRWGNQTIIIGAIVLAIVMLQEWGATGSLKAAVRTFYGTYRVIDRQDLRHLQMGTTDHGHELLAGPLRGRPILYYHPETAIGHLLSQTPPSWKHMGVVGLGAGVLAAWGNPGQTVDFYELDPGSEDLARRWFTYLASASAAVRVITGDGRRSLRARASTASKYDLLLLDAFNSDAVPIHLLTTEAVQEYRKNIATDGLLLFHISNRNLNLAPVLLATAQHLGLRAAIGQNPDNPAQLVAATRWLAMGSRSAVQRHLNHLPGWFSADRSDMNDMNLGDPTTPKTKLPDVSDGHEPIIAKNATIRPWTDQQASLLSAWPPDFSFLDAPLASPTTF